MPEIMTGMNVFCEGAGATAHDRLEIEADPTGHGKVHYRCPKCRRDANIGHKISDGLTSFVESQPLLREEISLTMLELLITRFRKQLG